MNKYTVESAETVHNKEDVCMYVTLSKTHDLVQDLNRMLNDGKAPKVYYTLFE